SNSEGFGGMSPAVATHKLEIRSVFCSTSLPLHWPTKRLEIPGLVFTRSLFANVGRRISASISNTLPPLWAIVYAIFTDVVLFPSPFRELVTPITRHPDSIGKLNSRLVRSSL